MADGTTSNKKWWIIGIILVVVIVGGIIYYVKVYKPAKKLEPKQPGAGPKIVNQTIATQHEANTTVHTAATL